MRVDEALGHAAENLARDDARVAARTHEGPVRDGAGDGLHVGIRGELVQLAHHGSQGEGHVGTRVAVGHGKDVQLVDVLSLVGNGLGGHGKAGAYGLGNHRLCSSIS